LEDEDSESIIKHQKNEEEKEEEAKVEEEEEEEGEEEEFKVTSEHLTKKIINDLKDNIAMKGNPYQVKYSCNSTLDWKNFFTSIKLDKYSLSFETIGFEPLNIVCQDEELCREFLKRQRITEQKDIKIITRQFKKLKGTLIFHSI
jgi:hypothetical protein